MKTKKLDNNMFKATEGNKTVYFTFIRTKGIERDREGFRVVVYTSYSSYRYSKKGKEVKTAHSYFNDMRRFVKYEIIPRVKNKVYRK